MRRERAVYPQSLEGKENNLFNHTPPFQEATKVQMVDVALSQHVQ